LPHERVLEVVVQAERRPVVEPFFQEERQRELLSA